MRTIALASALMTIWAAPLAAEGFQRIQDERGFLSLVKDRELRRLGVRLKVTDDGRIRGRAFGQQVTGAWNWEGGFFCRELEVAGDPFDDNCQLVQINGQTMRFIADKGAGIYADLKLN